MGVVHAFILILLKKVVETAFCKKLEKNVKKLLTDKKLGGILL